MVDEIGDSDTDPIKISTRHHDLDRYKLVETGTDTGIFTGEVILAGFVPHDADGEPYDARDTTDGSGPTGGLLETDDELSVSFQWGHHHSCVRSHTLEHGCSGSSIRATAWCDPDMNLNPEAADILHMVGFKGACASCETGVFQGAVAFGTGSADRLLVGNGDRKICRPYAAESVPYTRQLGVDRRDHDTRGAVIRSAGRPACTLKPPGGVCSSTPNARNAGMCRPMRQGPPPTTAWFSRRGDIRADDVVAGMHNDGVQIMRFYAQTDYGKLAA